MSDAPKKIYLLDAHPTLTGRLIFFGLAVYVIAWVWIKYERPLYLSAVAAGLLLFAGIIRWSYWSAKTEFDQLITKPGFRGHLTDVVTNSQPAWKVIYVDDKEPGQTVYLNWTTRVGLRRGVHEPTHVSWFIGDREPIGNSLACDYPVKVWPMEASRCLVKGDEAYFVCAVISRMSNHDDMPPS